MDKMGIVFAFFGVALAALMPGIGSAIGTGRAGQASAAVVADDPSKFGKVLVLQVLPGTQGIYGLVVAFVTMGLIGSQADMTLYKGLAFFGACLPAAFVCWLSALEQSKASVASINLISKRPDQLGRAIIFPAIVETYAILSLLISLLAVSSVAGLSI